MPVPIDPRTTDTPTVPRALVSASSGWSDLMAVMSTTAPRHLARARHTSRGLRTLIRRSR